jgi:hypothetical protein
MMTTTALHLTTLFRSLEDPRVDRTQKHQFMSILFIGMCGTLAGVDTWIGFEDYGDSHHDFFASHVDLPHGIPYHDTFSRVLGRLHIDAFTRCFAEFTQLVHKNIPGVIVILHGNT